MTYIPTLDPNSRYSQDVDALVDYFDEVMPGWQERERFGDTLLDERDFSLTDPESDAVSDEDWQAFLADSWTDPAERDW